jgi:hypothetical protein
MSSQTKQEQIQKMMQRKLAFQDNAVAKSGLPPLGADYASKSPERSTVELAGSKLAGLKSDLK